MQKWEYQVANPGNQRQMTKDELNAWGDKGWELISVVFGSGFEGEYGDGYSYHFKRPKS